MFLTTIFIMSSLRTVSRVLARTCFRRPTTTAVRWHGGPTVQHDAATITVTFLQPDGTPRSVEARVGESLLQTAHRHEIDLEGACEGVCACSTCHLILPMELYDTLEEPSEDEEDMLDMAFGLTETSRLGCQVIVRQDMDGVELQMPSATRNFYVGTSPTEEPWIGFVVGAGQQGSDDLLPTARLSLTVEELPAKSNE